MGLALMAGGAIGWAIGGLYQMHISRNAESNADNFGLFRYGSAPMITALQKISDGPARPKSNVLASHAALAHMYISNPVNEFGSLTRLISTHPPLEKRVQ